MRDIYYYRYPFYFYVRLGSKILSLSAFLFFFFWLNCSILPSSHGIPNYSLNFIVWHLSEREHKIIKSKFNQQTFFVLRIPLVMCCTNELLRVHGICHCPLSNVQYPGNCILNRIVKRVNANFNGILYRFCFVWPEQKRKYVEIMKSYLTRLTSNVAKEKIKEVQRKKKKKKKTNTSNTEVIMKLPFKCGHSSSSH